MTTAEYLRILTQMVDAVSVEGIERALTEKAIGPTVRVDVRAAAWRLGMIVWVIDRWECEQASVPEKPGLFGDAVPPPELETYLREQQRRVDGGSNGGENERPINSVSSRATLRRR